MNMIQDILYQISVFGDVASIKPDIETVQSMIKRFSHYGLIPSIFQEGNLTLSHDLGLQQAETINRLQMLSLEKGINVMFASNRIDISKASVDTSTSVNQYDLNELLGIMNIATSGLASTRIAFNTTSLLDNPSVSLYQRIQPGLDIYDNPDELMFRVNKRKDIAISDVLSEKSNVILTIQKTMGQLLINNQPMSVDNGLIIQFDINTPPEVAEPRFFSEQTRMYIEAAALVKQRLLSDLIS